MPGKKMRTGRGDQKWGIWKDQIGGTYWGIKKRDHIAGGKNGGVWASERSLERNGGSVRGLTRSARPLPTGVRRVRI